MQFIRSRLASRGIFWGFASAAVIDFVTLIAVILRVRPSDPEVPLRYVRGIGVDLVAPWYGMYLLPLLGLGILGFNLLLAIRTRERGASLSYYLVVVTLLAEILVLISTLLFLGRL